MTMRSLPKFTDAWAPVRWVGVLFRLQAISTHTPYTDTCTHTYIIHRHT